MNVDSGQSFTHMPDLHIVLIEDNPQDVELVQHELRRAKFHFTSVIAQTAEEFRREVQLRRPDLVLADYSLPQWSGMDALEILAEERLVVPLILVSGALGEETAVECIKKGATDYVLKRALARLPLAIRRAIEERDKRERMEMAEDLFRCAVESSPNGILIVDEAGNIILANRQTERLFGYKSAELMGQSFEMLVPGDFREHHRGLHAALQHSSLERSISNQRDIVCPRKDGGSFSAEIVLTPVKASGGPHTLAVVIDITARKKAEREAEEHVRELRRSNEELQQFAYVASHDLQEPLRMVASYTGLLAERYRGKLDENADKYIGYAVDGARRMQRMIQDLLAYARVHSQAKPLQPIDPATVLTSIVANLRSTIEKSNAHIIWDKLPTVSADEGQLGQVFQNLIGNACKFHGQEPPRIEVRAESAGEMWKFSVSDNGIGIAKESGGRIFQMFQRLHTREEFEGTGIGLAIAKRVVERHGGQIWFDSVPGEGTTFYFTIPKAERGENERALASSAGGG
jgi:PAS domain S-box-containing protein